MQGQIEVNSSILERIEFRDIRQEEHFYPIRQRHRKRQIRQS